VAVVAPVSLEIGCPPTRIEWHANCLSKISVAGVRRCEDWMGAYRGWAWLQRQIDGGLA